MTKLALFGALYRPLPLFVLRFVAAVSCKDLAKSCVKRTPARRIIRSQMMAIRVTLQSKSFKGS